MFILLFAQNEREVTHFMFFRSFINSLSARHTLSFSSNLGVCIDTSFLLRFTTGSFFNVVVFTNI